MNSLIFKINTTTKVVIEVEESLGEAHCCTEGLVALYYNDQKFDLSNHSVRECLQDFKYMAEKLLKKELQLHESITKDIGFLFNEELQYKPGLVQVQRGDSYIWVGYDYLLIMGYAMAVWLYNKNDGSVVCEASPKFPFSYRNVEKDKDYIPYNKWLKNYKPYFIEEASLDLIKEWISLAADSLVKIQQNIDRMKKECCE